MTRPNAVAKPSGRPKGIPYPVMPEDWVGIYKTIDDVPVDYRLDGTADEDELARREDDAFEAFLSTLEDVSESHKDRRYRKGYRDFRDFVQDRGRHPTVATPDDVEAFVTAARNGEFSGPGYDRIKSVTVVMVYLRPVLRAYDWFVSRVDYPHIYNPVTMAALEDGATRDAWIAKVKIDNHEYYED